MLVNSTVGTTKEAGHREMAGFQVCLIESRRSDSDSNGSYKARWTDQIQSASQTEERS